MRRSAAFREVDDVKDGYDAVTLSLSDVLRQRTKEFFLFTPALLTTHSEFDRDPVGEFAVRFPGGKDEMPFCIDLRRDNEFFFSGLGAKPLPGRQKVINWDKRLYCVDKSRREDCVSFISGIIFSNPRSGHFGSVFYYDLTISDPTARNYEDLNVGVFGVRTNKQVVFLAPRLNAQPVVKSVPADKLFLCPPQIIEACALSVQIGDDPLTMRDDKNG